MSRHLEGKRNVISDYLSFEGEERKFQKRKWINGKLKIFERFSVNPVAYDFPPNDVVTHRIVSQFPQLVPKGFKICQLPHDVLSFAQEAVQMLELSFIREQKEQAKKLTDTGDDGKVSAIITWAELTPALKEYCQKNNGSL